MKHAYSFTLGFCILQSCSRRAAFPEQLKFFVRSERFCVFTLVGGQVITVALREFLYPTIGLKLVLARRLDVDTAAAKYGVFSAAYQKVAAQIRISPIDAKRLDVKEGNLILVSSKTGEVVVRVHIDEKTPEDIAIMSPGPYANALLSTALPYQGIRVTLKSTDAAITKVEELP